MYYNGLFKYLNLHNKYIDVGDFLVGQTDVTRRREYSLEL